MDYLAPNMASIPILLHQFAYAGLIVYAAGVLAIILLGIAAVIATHDDDKDKILGLHLTLAILWPVVALNFFI